MKLSIAIPCSNCGSEYSSFVDVGEDLISVECDTCGKISSPEKNDFNAVEAWNEENFIE